MTSFVEFTPGKRLFRTYLYINNLKTKLETKSHNIDVRKIGHLNIKTKMFDIEACVLIGWYSLASQSERVPTRCFYVKETYLSYGEYS